jgi:transposase InsO family protein
VFSDLIIRGRLSLFQFNLEIYTKYFTLPGAAYTSNDFNNYLTSNNSKHSLSAPGTSADNAVIEHYWGDFKYIWMAHHSHPQTLAELKALVKQGVEYFNTVEISSKRNNLTAEDFRNEAV